MALASLCRIVVPLGYLGRNPESLRHRRQFSDAGRPAPGTDRAGPPGGKSGAARAGDCAGAAGDPDPVWYGTPFGARYRAHDHREGADAEGDRDTERGGTDEDELAGASSEEGDVAFDVGGCERDEVDDRIVFGATQFLCERGIIDVRGNGLHAVRQPDAVLSATKKREVHAALRCERSASSADNARTTDKKNFHRLIFVADSMRSDEAWLVSHQQQWFLFRRNAASRVSQNVE